MNATNMFALTRAAAPWFFAIALGTASHLAWWFQKPAVAQVQVVEVPVPVPSDGPTQCGCTCTEAAASPLPEGAAVDADRTMLVVRSADERYEVDVASLEDPAILARSARIVPNLQNGEVAGFKVYAVRAGGIAAALGLQNGDLMTAINDVRLSDLADVMPVLAGAREGREVQLHVERDGKVVVKTILFVGGDTEKQ